MITGNTMRNSETTLSRTLLNCHSTMNATAVTSDAPIDNAFTSDPMAGSSMASARMSPAHNPSEPTHSAGRARVEIAWRYTPLFFFGTSSNMGWSKSISRLFSDIARAKNGVMTSGIRYTVTARGMRCNAKYSTEAYAVPRMRSRLPASESWLANSRCHSM